jgi:DNA-binding winged helix-turn-helix (wHTH) protein
MARARPATLISRSADNAQGYISLGDVTTIGRSETCDVVISHSIVSRLHARITLEHDRYILSDAGSANGTYVNGEQVVEGRQLSSGDEIWLGSADVTLSFSDPDETLNVTAISGPPPLLVDESAREVHVHGVPVQLTTLEYELLRYLAEAPHAVRTREECFQAVWGQAYDHATCEDALNACVARLRRNLRAAAESVRQEPPVITTIKRIGLRLDSEVTVVPAPRPREPLRQQELGAMS